jgi:NADH:ubiquinone oxidoreductase subunit H
MLENFISLLFNLSDVLSVILPVLLSVAFMTIIERKQLAAHQRRVGPVKVIWEIIFKGKTIKLRGHPKDYSTKL